jgi:predicted transcriptional regulator
MKVAKRHGMRRVADAMTAPAVVVQPATTVQATSAGMLDARVQVAVVVDKGRVCGLVTAERVSEALAQGLDASETQVRAIAEQDPPVVAADEPLAEAHERMRETGHTVVPVVDEDQRPVGVLQDLE